MSPVRLSSEPLSRASSSERPSLAWSSEPLSEPCSSSSSSCCSSSFSFFSCSSSCSSWSFEGPGSAAPRWAPRDRAPPRPLPRWKHSPRGLAPEAPPLVRRWFPRLAPRPPRRIARRSHLLRPARHRLPTRRVRSSSWSDRLSDWLPSWLTSSSSDSMSDHTTAGSSSLRKSRLRSPRMTWLSHDDPCAPSSLIGASPSGGRPRVGRCPLSGRVRVPTGQERRRGDPRRLPAVVVAVHVAGELARAP